jgi:hypothetical protein
MKAHLDSACHSDPEGSRYIDFNVSIRSVGIEIA